MDSTRWTTLGAVTLSLVAVGVFWYTLPESGPPATAAPPPAPIPTARNAGPATQPSPRPKAPRARPARGEGSRGQDGAPPPRGREAKARSLEGRDIPDDVLVMIEEVRAERVANSAEKLSMYAELAKWDEQTTASVQGLVEAAHDEVDAVIAEATNGELPWTEVRGEVRSIRIEQARAVRDELGEEEFRRFAKAMGRSRSRRGKRP